MKEVTIVIPVYTSNLGEHEKSSLMQVRKVLGNYPIVIVKPNSLDVSLIKELAPEIEYKSFPDYFFKGIKGYNKLMLSPQFYTEFADSKYILVHQLDAWIFKDTLKIWCEKDYDYIGAPWIKRSIYNKPVIKQYTWFVSKIKRLFNRPDKQILYNRAGNGGLSLRKIESHIGATLYCKEIIEDFTSKKRFHMYNEDVFWSVIVNNYYNKAFNYPDYMEALQFSFDKYPAYCYELNGNELPFGCHGWSKKEMYPFWKKIITPII